MPVSEFEIKRWETLTNKFIEKRRPPVHLRNQLDLSFKITNHSIEIFEIQPLFNDPHKITEIPIAKATFIRSQNIWKIFWQRADLKWHRYHTVPEVKNLEDFLQVVDADELACFFG
jgi:hypothetical protein